jgi:hypothetical protein
LNHSIQLPSFYSSGWKKSDTALAVSPKFKVPSTEATAFEKHPGRVHPFTGSFPT